MLLLLLRYSVADAFPGTDNTMAKPVAPINDEPCSAIILPISTICNYRSFSNSGATATPGVPAPGCADYQGGDTWFQIRVPTNQTLIFDMQAGSLTDAGMAIYQGTTCNNLTLLYCDDNSSDNPKMPRISTTGLIPGSKIWIRVWGSGNTSGSFGICVSLPLTVPACAGNNAAANDCSTATPVCNFNGYCGNTSRGYTADTWPELSTAFRDCIGGSSTIENNSFISFIASEASAVFNVWVTSSINNNGIQMMFYEGGCGSGPVTCHGAYNNITGGPNLVTVTDLVPGQKYYLMIDGVGSDNCDYTINPATGVDLLDINPDPAKVCRGGKIPLTAIGGNGIYTWSPATGLSSTFGATVTASPASTTTYTVSTTGEGNCPAVLTKQITVSVTPPPFSTDSVSICSSQLPYAWNGQSISSGGIYAKTIRTADGCDSLSRLVLAIKPNTTGTSIIGVCPAQLPFRWNGINCNSSGTYSAILNNAAGCDSTAVLNLTVGPFSSTVSNVSICPVQLPYRWNNHVISSTGSYADTVLGSYGCDSISTLVLAVKATTASITDTSICSSALPFLWNGKIYSAGGNYNITLANAAGCDSVATLRLKVIPGNDSITRVSICKADLPYTWNGNDYNDAGIYRVTATNVAGCDSVSSLVLSIQEASSSTISKVLCPGQLPYTQNGHTYTAAGSYKDTLLNAAGCDSVTTLVLSVKEAPVVFLGGDTSLCPNDSITLRAGNYAHYLWQDGSSASTFKVTQPGNYSVTVTDGDGCSGNANIQVNYLESCLDISFPTAIAPYGTGGNKNFGALGNLAIVSNYSLSVYNRQAQLVFYTNDPYQRWDGIYKNKARGNENFVWYARYIYKGKSQRVQKGNLLVLR